MIKKRPAILLLLILSAASLATANVIYVDSNSPGDPGAGTLEDPYRRIQAALDAADGADTVLIRPGIYTGAGNYNLDPQGKSIIISSIDPNDPDVTALTIIDADAQGRGFYIHRGEDANCILSGLTIKNAYTAEIGAGIYCETGNPTIINCSLINNHTGPEGYGGAVFCVESNSLFINCTIRGNSALDGGGVSIRAGYPQMINCIISNNHAGRYGGGVDCLYAGNPNIVNCSLISNTAGPSGAGGAISLCDSNVSIKNSILWANDAENGKQLYLYPGSSIVVSYCDVQGGIPDVCFVNSDLIWGPGNINTDPCFAVFDPNNDPNVWDFHLLSRAGRWACDLYPAVDITQNGFVDLRDFAVLAGLWLQEGIGLPADLDNSNKVDLLDLKIMLNEYLVTQPKGVWIKDNTSSPCIDAGSPDSVWSSEPWPNGKRINMGAYGGTPKASKNGLETDFDADGFVNFEDFSYLATNWGLQQRCIEDLDGNAVVNLVDFFEFCTWWLEQF
ncbi:MAG: right-handed parallel beta-helix repeat-containing protein [Sedimentisphaerales bacterium]|nr:right-handed parallel beta-helix repeat-containing protein [Sedimentisphaerales bacterium]